MGMIEADIVLGYIEGHDFALMSNEQFQTVLHDTEEEEKYGYSKDQPYTIREVVEFCRDMNEDLLRESSDNENCDSSYIFDLKKDSFILDGIMEKIVATTPPVIRQYNIDILERLRRVVTVEAASWEEARSKVEQAWKNGEYVLTAENFEGVTFS